MKRKHTHIVQVHSFELQFQAGPDISVTYNKPTVVRWSGGEMRFNVTIDDERKSVVRKDVVVESGIFEWFQCHRNNMPFGRVNGAYVDVAKGVAWIDVKSDYVPVGDDMHSCTRWADIGFTKNEKEIVVVPFSEESLIAALCDWVCLAPRQSNESPSPLNKFAWKEKSKTACS